MTVRATMDRVSAVVAGMAEDRRGEIDQDVRERFRRSEER